MADIETSAVAGTGEPTFEQTSRFVNTPRGRLHYNEVGNGQPVILLHGSGPGATSWTNFLPNIGPLSKKFRVIALDVPGWGLSAPNDPTVTPMVPSGTLAVLALMDALKIDKAALVGNSMGGMIALHFAETQNDRLTHLVTMGSGLITIPSIFSPAGLSEGMKVLVQAYRDPSPESFRNLIKVMVFDSSLATDALFEARSKAALANPGHLTNFLKMFAHPGGVPVTGEAVAALSKIKTPALFIHGRDDRVLSIEHSLRLLSIVPNSRLHVFNRCGHWAQIEHADEFNVLVANFLASN